MEQIPTLPQGGALEQGSPRARQPPPGLMERKRSASSKVYIPTGDVTTATTTSVNTRPITSGLEANGEYLPLEHMFPTFSVYHTCVS